MKEKTPSPEISKIELLPDAAERFERAVTKLASHAPMPRKALVKNPRNPKKTVPDRKRPKGDGGLDA